MSVEAGARRDDRRTVKVFRDGTHRVVAPAETVANAQRLFGPIGITRVANLTHLDCIGIPVASACRPDARSLSVSMGKGTNLDAARASAIMEAIELYHAERIQGPLKLASWNELRFSHPLADLEKLPRTSVAPLNSSRPLLWIAGEDLFSSKETWLPYEVVHMDYRLPLPPAMGCFVMSSNGLASGNHIIEALVHGVAEVIERDAIVLFRMMARTEQDQRHVDLRTVANPECRRLLDLYENAGLMVGAWDITSDIAIPAFRCVILDRELNSFRPIGPLEGLGCHPVRDVALLRALTEAAQSRLTLIFGARDDNGRSEYVASQDAATIECARERLLETGTRPFDAVPTRWNDTIEEDLQHLLVCLSNAGLEQAVALDLSKREFGIPVVRVVVPGLEPYHQVPDFIPGARARRAARGGTAGNE